MPVQVEEKIIVREHLLVVQKGKHPPKRATEMAIHDETAQETPETTFKSQMHVQQAAY